MKMCFSIEFRFDANFDGLNTKHFNIIIIQYRFFPRVCVSRRVQVKYTASQNLSCDSKTVIINVLQISIFAPLSPSLYMPPHPIFYRASTIAIVDPLTPYSIVPRLRFLQEG